MERFIYSWYNNCGDHITSNLNDKIPSCVMEREVIYFFAKHLKLAREEAWGHYGASSSECILYALYQAREYVEFL